MRAKVHSAFKPHTFVESVILANPVIVPAYSSLVNGVAPSEKHQAATLSQ